MTDIVPVDRLGQDQGKSHAIVAIGLPFDFNFDHYPLLKATTTGTVEWLIPASVLSKYPRAVWPD